MRASHPNSPCRPLRHQATAGAVVKDAQLELAHAWGLPAGVELVGDVTALGHGVIERAVRAYVGARRGRRQVQASCRRPQVVVTANGTRTTTCHETDQPQTAQT